MARTTATTHEATYHLLPDLGAGPTHVVLRRTPHQPEPGIRFPPYEWVAMTHAEWHALCALSHHDATAERREAMNQAMCPGCHAVGACSCDTTDHDAPDTDGSRGDPDPGDTLLVRLCLGAVAAADEELDHLEVRLLDRTGDRHVATLRRMGRLMHLKAWCQRHIHRIDPPRMVSHHDAIPS